MVNGIELTTILVAVGFWSCGRGRKLGAVLGLNATVIGIAYVGLM